MKPVALKFVKGSRQELGVAVELETDARGGEPTPTDPPQAARNTRLNKPTTNRISALTHRETRELLQAAT
jgi:hypothetical protein